MCRAIIGPLVWLAFSCSIIPDNAEEGRPSAVLTSVHLRVDGRILKGLVEETENSYVINWSGDLDPFWFEEPVISTVYQLNESRHPIETTVNFEDGSKWIERIKYKNVHQIESVTHITTDSVVTYSFEHDQCGLASVQITSTGNWKRGLWTRRGDDSREDCDPDFDNPYRIAGAQEYIGVYPLKENFQMPEDIIHCGLSDSYENGNDYEVLALVKIRDTYYPDRELDFFSSIFRKVGNWKLEAVSNGSSATAEITGMPERLSLRSLGFGGCAGKEFMSLYEMIPLISFPSDLRDFIALSSADQFRRVYENLTAAEHYSNCNIRYQYEIQ